MRSACGEHGRTGVLSAVPSLASWMQELVTAASQRTTIRSATFPAQRFRIQARLADRAGQTAAHLDRHRLSTGTPEQSQQAAPSHHLRGHQYSDRLVSPPRTTMTSCRASRSGSVLSWTTNCSIWRKGCRTRCSPMPATTSSRGPSIWSLTTSPSILSSSPTRRGGARGDADGARFGVRKDQPGRRPLRRLHPASPSLTGWSDSRNPPASRSSANSSRTSRSRRT